ncbi:MAG: PD40 domain-containing protein, partial [Anaerolineaceae bacterium]|nr:PD40 domain-containing protein [Anaerolineaceae bacterium]
VLPNPGSLPTQNPTAIAIAAEATVTAMANNKPPVQSSPTPTALVNPATPTTQVIGQPTDFWLSYLWANNIYVSNRDGSQISLLTNTPGFDYLPTWSPDGKNLAFIRFNGDNRQDGILHILPAGSDTPRQLDPNTTYGYFTWMPGSQKILAVRGFAGSYEIYFIDTVSGASEQIAKNAAEYPRISQDGNSILLLLMTGSSCNGKGCVSPNDYFMYDVVTRKTKQLTGDAQPKMSLGWSPDGQLIAYYLPNDPSGNAEIIQSDGKYVGSEPDHPWWTNIWRISPDGSLIAYAQNNTNNGSFDLFIRPISGGNPQKINHTGNSADEVFYIDTLRWRPDGTGLIFNIFDKIFTVNLDGSDLHQVPVKLDNVFFDVRPTNVSFTPPPAPTAPASWKLCPDALDSRMDIGRQAQVSTNPPTPNNVRESPTKQAKVIGQIQPGEKVQILSGPICDHGTIWWEVISLSSNLKGYTLEGDQKTYWLEPVK